MNITVTKPFMPALSEYQSYLTGIWDREWLTNNGPLVNELELQLRSHLSADSLLFLSNGTVALQIAIKALNLSGEIITTPFSYVATTSSIVWENCVPVMVDIDPYTFNIDPQRIEAAITERTSAIIATHVFGNPCDVEAIEAVASRYKLKIVYDAAHAFGTRYKGRSLLTYGDVATCSFHATKVFHSVEGGAVLTSNATIARQMELMRNFGHVSATEFGSVGINGKNSELHAAMGLCNLKHIGELFETRAMQYDRYLAALRSTPVKFQRIFPDTEYNYAYFPILLENESQLLRVTEALNIHSVYPRRYFYPSLSQLPYVNGQKAPIAEDVSRRVLCLPLYHKLSLEEMDMLCRVIIRTLRYE